VTAGIVELTPDEIDAFLEAQVVGRIGVHADGTTYVVPVIYAYVDGALHVYTVEGQKVRMMREQPEVCFEVDEYDADGRGSWRSVIVQGRYEELEGADAERVRSLLAARFRRGLEGEEARERRPRGGGRSAVAFRIAIDSVTGRAVRR
jgi:nitroimidazol reductase NimA-like FMN-containing flavoprotein (pyridoxamine 5'-phosphate oxidase superfamily)